MVICNDDVFVRLVLESLRNDDGDANEDGKKAIGWRPGAVYTRRFATTIFTENNTALQCWNNVVTIRNNVATMLQRCVALKIVVANRLV